MVTVRWGTFETNSSSVHSMVIATDKELRQFKAGKLFVDRLPGFSDDITDSTAELIDMDEVYRRYQDADEDSYVLPKISKLTLRELMIDPLNYNDYEYVESNIHERPHQSWSGCWNDTPVNWNFSKHKYSKRLLKELKDYHGLGLYWLLYSNSFPHSYNMLIKRTDKDNRSEQKMNVLKFEIWD